MQVPPELLDAPEDEVVVPDEVLVVPADVLVVPADALVIPDEAVVPPDDVVVVELPAEPPEPTETVPPQAGTNTTPTAPSAKITGMP